MLAPDLAAGNTTATDDGKQEDDFEDEDEMDYDEENEAGGDLQLEEYGGEFDNADGADDNDLMEESTLLLSIASATPSFEYKAFLE